MLLILLLSTPYILRGQIENQVRDDNPGLFKNQRLSVQPVTKDEWDIIISFKS